MEKQLVVKQTVLSRMLGDTVIADVAIIGTDMFFREGAAYGILFHARNNLGLSTSFVQQRLERINQGGVTEEKVKFGEKVVSYLASPDGTVRSYYVADGDFHFITTSKHLVARFLATASGKGALGASREFRHARSIMPLSRGDTVWASQRNLASRSGAGERSVVRVMRRLRAAGLIELLKASKSKGEASLYRLEARPERCLDSIAAPRPTGATVAPDHDHEEPQPTTGTGATMAPV